ncbi:MAG: DNA polymerase I [Desulfobacteraceae bacterium]|nr:MAG: DNA polymerase I [Desulfobacteraceae bacterium]
MKSVKKTIYVVDGTSYIHRAYHAIRNLSSSQGLPTNAIFGFTRMLMKLLDDKSPEYGVVAFDVKGPTFRHKIFKDYKATRPPMPEDMAVQIPYIKEVVHGLNLVVLEKQGYEADDIIGTIARLGQEQGYNVVIVSGDKDFRQILSENTVMWDSMNDKLTDSSTIRRDYGIEPEQIIQVMALSGDTSDNIPGIPGVGEKTAINLIQQFGSIENVFEHTDQVTRPSLRSKLEQFKEQAYLSKKLVTINSAVPLDITPDDLRLKLPQKERLAEIFRELEFKSLVDRFSEHAELSKKDYRLILKIEELESLTESIRKKGLFCLDTETTSKNALNAELVGISFCLEPGTAYYAPLGHTSRGKGSQIDIDEALILLKGILCDDKVKKIGQNIKYDAEVLARYGINLEGLSFDTMIASYLIDPTLRQHNLDYLAQHYLGYKMISYDEVTGHNGDISFASVDVDRAKEYSCEDAEITLLLKTILEDKLRETDNCTLFQDLEMKLIPVIMEMEMTGIKIDVDFFKKMSKKFADELSGIESRIFDLTGEKFNINSPQQLGYILFEKLKLPVKKKTKKKSGYSTDVEVLTELAGIHEIPSLLLRFRTISKLKSTYLDALVSLVNPATGRVHTSYNQTVTATGRLSSSNPNLQNIPIRTDEGREIRKGFIADSDHLLLSADYSQIELRVFAHYSEDPVLLEAFESGEDIHTRTAAEVFDLDPKMVTPEMRRMAKTINFGIIYGMGPIKLAKELGISKKVAQAYLDNYYERYKGVKDFKEKIVSQAVQNGYVATLLKRRRYLPNINSENGNLRGEAERAAINTPIQGTAADLIKMAMINIANRLKREHLETKMLLQVHDELVFEVPKGELPVTSKIIKDEMEGVYRLNIPLKVDINWGTNWGEAH